MNELAKIDSFRKEIAVAETIDEIKLLTTKGEILAEMAKKLKVPINGQNELGITRIELEKKKRELIEKMFPKGGDRKSKSKLGNTTLKNFNITKDESAQAKLITEEEELVSEAIEEIEKSKTEIITPQKVASKVRKKKKQIEKEIKAKQGENLKIDIDFRLGDFEEVLADIPDGSIDCIITDPPYPLEFIECWTKLARFAKKKLKSNGFCIAYSGQLNLPEVIIRMSECLDYYWTFALIHTGNRQLINARNVFCGWKPLLVFQNGFKRNTELFDDFIIGSGREKDQHEWQQAEDELTYIIENFTNPGDLVVDPFAGGGTTIIASKKLNRNIIAAEINEESYNITKERIYSWEN